MCSLINKQLLLTAYAYLFIMGQQGSEALQLQVETKSEALLSVKQLLAQDFWTKQTSAEEKIAAIKKHVGLPVNHVLAAISQTFENPAVWIQKQSENPAGFGLAWLNTLDVVTQDQLEAKMGDGTRRRGKDGKPVVVPKELRWWQEQMVVKVEKLFEIQVLADMIFGANVDGALRQKVEEACTRGKNLTVDANPNENDKKDWVIRVLNDESVSDALFDLGRTALEPQQESKQRQQKQGLSHKDELTIKYERQLSKLHNTELEDRFEKLWNNARDNNNERQDIIDLMTFEDNLSDQKLGGAEKIRAWQALQKKYAAGYQLTPLGEHFKTNSKLDDHTIFLNLGPKNRAEVLQILTEKWYGKYRFVREIGKEAGRQALDGFKKTNGGHLSCPVLAKRDESSFQTDKDNIKWYDESATEEDKQKIAKLLAELK